MFLKATLALAFVAVPLQAAELAGDRIDHIRPFPVIMYQESQAKELAPLAKEIGELLRITVVQGAKKNPVCCVWLEISNYQPNPGQEGYIILNQEGGSLIQAINIDQMKLAVTRFRASTKKTDDGIAVPRGLLTNYQVVP